ncbi:Cell wall-associated hydrolase, NlpC family [Actinokineospora alba]|uniref:Cell wall-associated hydrolase, NlpC family n=2 Tax=Actinokineospora alba TaxID=504798 RepID=A0A1H0WDF4_9PSEU|nr:cell wall-associated NlpC family hydrolase [Actinokineospora alba]SDI73691.1 Cell wall-associated hydrolase, NlpC family [Actinokineospora alba]SDP88628.1 Cell wall-associated hydrolase, NlpC family [Actinokineospora alba]
MGKRRGSRAFMIATSLSLVISMAVPATAVAVPPPPPNPSDSELSAGRTEAKAKAGKVGELTNQLAKAEARLMELQAEVEAKMEDANKALVDLETAEELAAKAKADAEAAKRESDSAGQSIENARKQLDEFAAGSYKQGTTVGSMSAYMGAKSPEDLLARAQLLNAVSGSELDALESMERARTVKANKDSLARAALDEATKRQAEAEQAKRNADAATATAQQAQRDQAGKSQELEAARADYERQLNEAQAKVGGLENQRKRYQDWLAAKQREDAANAAAAQASAPAGPRPAVNRPPTGNAVRIVIDRALSQLGVQYAWGGGNGKGPTRGIRDGGVADSFGDYNKVGFDCSGLMIYAFAGVGIRLPHYSGYQAAAGRRVPLNQMAPGDMLFWATRGRIHHVAMYIGNGQMVEAPYSGSRVRIAPVRYGGIVPYATRLL